MATDLQYQSGFGHEFATEAVAAPAERAAAGATRIRKRTELAWQTAGALAVVLLLASVM
jgi:hypothetical protein